jgi:hypothetical protein
MSNSHLKCPLDVQLDTNLRFRICGGARSRRHLVFPLSERVEKVRRRHDPGQLRPAVQVSDHPRDGLDGAGRQRLDTSCLLGGSVMRPADNNGGFDLDSRNVSASRRTLRFPLHVNGLSRDRRRPEGLASALRL